MRGYDRLVAMRLRGRVPCDGVLFAVDPKGTPRLHELQPELDGKVVRIDVAEDEPMARADLRGVVGLRVMVVGDDERQVAAVGERCAECGASAVIAGRYRHRWEGWQFKPLFSLNPWTEQAEWLD